MNIFVGSLPFTLGEADLKQLFEAYGEVNSVKIIIDRESGRSKGFGFIEMADAEVKGRSIAVSQAEEKKPGGDRRSSGGGYGGGNRGGGGGYGGGGNRGGGGGGYSRDNRGGGGKSW
jgi:hypothetical protein